MLAPQADSAASGTGSPVSVDQLKTYRQGLAQYHLHPESKFLGGDYLDRGLTERRHVQVSAIRHIGKEANRLDEQQALGVDDRAQVDYGASPAQREAEIAALWAEAETTSIAAVARRLGVSRQALWQRLRNGQVDLVGDPAPG